MVGDRWILSMNLNRLTDFRALKAIEIKGDSIRRSPPVLEGYIVRGTLINLKKARRR